MKLKYKWKTTWNLKNTITVMNKNWDFEYENYYRDPFLENSACHKAKKIFFSSLKKEIVHNKLKIINSII